MNIEFASLPLAWFAGVLGILSPCVWPIIPVVMGAASISGFSGPLFLSLGLMSSFAAAGTFLTFILLNMGLDPEWFRYFGAFLLLLIALTLLIKTLGNWVSDRLSLLTARFSHGPAKEGINAPGQFLIGATLGLVWLPCVGPTVGAAIALASIGQNMVMAFAVMLAFGLGTASALLFAGMASHKVLNRWRPGLLANAQLGKQILGWVLLILGLMVLSGADKVLEAWVVQTLPKNLTTI
ncbi:TPA: cytochrome c biogenesis protein CcdA [Legionella pneumophila]|nr:cytochrome c biogenesis protein CcdA [Legionella pneumophila]HAT8258176.1 cytochrome c biogenesis protein CcdA [Legionella pneumophila]HAT8260478.1 cytochrome c biogenesis protein CcdA [Legionella pneumophila]HAT8270666.1 cytochrome c biogenesis protein CcdA [Legionella pneumophila]HAT8273791.1 cytochrome c biogenesis protein CcdA [Legionella pneumophila]